MTVPFYDDLAPFYHLIFADWEESITRQAAILDGIIRQEWGDGVETILDVSCGIGTQSIGLAQLGYHVTASDLSPQAVARAGKEAAARGLHIDFSVADMRQVYGHHQREFDVLISCDNSVPHLLSDEEIQDAFREFYRCLRSGGGCLISVRDYDREVRSGIQVKPYGIREQDGIRYVIFQVWEFEGDCYRLSMYIIQDEGGSACLTHVFRTKYYAVSPTRLEELLRDAGFIRVRRIDGDFYQPVIVGSKS